MVKKETIETVINNILQDYNPLHTKCSIIKSSIYYANALHLSEKYGLRLKKCTRTELRFEDKHEKSNPLNEDINSTELRFDSMMKNSWINMLDDSEDIDNGIYSLDTVLGYYTGMPQELKNRTGLITFDSVTEPNYSTIYDPYLHKQNVVHITLDAFSVNHSNTHNLERIMAHEMGHCFEMSKLNSNEKKLIKELFVDGKKTGTPREVELYKSIVLKNNTYSNPDGIFGKAVLKDYEDCMSNYGLLSVADVIPSDYAKDYYYNDNGVSRFSEHFAETVSVLSFRDKEDKTNATLYGREMMPSSPITYYEYVLESGQINSIPVVEELLYGNSKNYDIGYVEY